MQFNKKGFSLIEVVIATSVISITVFGIYRLIGENTKIINNSSNYLQVHSLFPILKECINNKINTFSYSEGYSTGFYLINYNDCQLINSGTIIDNIEYNLSSKVITSTNKYTNWELIISSDTIKTQTGFYKQIKNPIN